MKQLSDSDIANMIGDDFIPENDSVKKSVRQSLQLSKRIPKQPQQTPAHTVIDFHNHTEEEAWKMLTQLATSGAHTATVITGASGILKTKFQQWATESVLSPTIVSFEPINNGSFKVKFHRNKKQS